ncbi:hypothetical protein LSAT2_027025 [Lamellibrachia satsuma]|nr:hypothetical protein LSAT2_027025 [Lamellibrachia satsuma]
MSSSTRLVYLIAMWKLAGTLIIMPSTEQQILDPSLGMSTTPEEMAKKNYTDCTVSVLLDPADKTVTVDLISTLVDTIKDTLKKMRIDGQLMFVHPTPYVSNNMLWLCYYVAKPKGGVVHQNTLIAATGEIDFEEKLNLAMINMHRNHESLWIV